MFCFVSFCLIANCFFENQTAQAAKFCSDYASPRAAGVEFGAGWNPPTRTLVAFFRELLQRGKLGDEDLLKMRDGLVQGKRVSPFPRAGNTNIENTQFAGVVNNLFTSGLNIAHVILWIDGELRAKVNDNDRRRVQQKQTRFPARSLNWIRVEPDTFEWGGESTTLTNPFLVSDAPITQSQWIEVMGENSSGIEEDEETAEVTFYDRKSGKVRFVRCQPDHPIVKITWYSAAEFANRLSILEGLPPVFDFSRLKQVSGTRAEDGTLAFFSEQIWINAPEGDIYKAKGYRFLTEGERDALYRKAGADKLNHLEFLDRAWVSENSNSKFHSVATRVPFNVDGSDIFDLMGNVEQWLYDGGALSNEYKGGVDPQKNPAHNSRRKIFGGGRECGVEVCRLGMRLNAAAGQCNMNIGLRLARTVE